LEEGKPETGFDVSTGGFCGRLKWEGY